MTTLLLTPGSTVNNAPGSTLYGGASALSDDSDSTYLHRVRNGGPPNYVYNYSDSYALFEPGTFDYANMTVTDMRLKLRVRANVAGVKGYASVYSHDGATEFQSATYPPTMVGDIEQFTSDRLYCAADLASNGLLVYLQFGSDTGGSIPESDSVDYFEAQIEITFDWIVPPASDNLVMPPIRQLQRGDQWAIGGVPRSVQNRSRQASLRSSTSFT